MTYAQFADAMSWLVIFFVAVVAPELVSRDLRSGVLPLYFSRPLPRVDYALAKLLALVTALWLLLGGPQLVMFLGGAFTTCDGLRGVWNELLDLLPGLLYAGLWAVVFASIGAAGRLADRQAGLRRRRDRGGLPDDHPDRRRAVDPAVPRGQRAGLPRLAVDAGRRGGHLGAR